MMKTKLSVLTQVLILCLAALCFSGCITVGPQRPHVDIVSVQTVGGLGITLSAADESVAVVTRPFVWTYETIRGWFPVRGTNVTAEAKGGAK